MSFCEVTLMRRFIEWLNDDSPFGDITSEIVVPKEVKAEAVVVAKSRGIASSIDIVSNVLRLLGLEVKALIEDGKAFSNGKEILRLRGDAQKILLVERTLLNLLIYLFGVATSTRMFVDKVRRINPKVRIAATRKYPPGLGCLVKRAVRDGGGDTHRFSLSDMILIKDNHIKLAGGVKEAVKKAVLTKSFAHKVEVEVSNAQDALEAAELGVDIIMFDNMDPDEIREAIDLLRRKGLREKVMLEASGGIDLDNIERYAVLDLDVISTSYITMRPERIDLSLEVL